MVCNVPLAIVVPMEIYKGLTTIAFDRLEELRLLAQREPIRINSSTALELERLEKWSDWESMQYELGNLR